ncbi:MAG: hypothetical protein ABS938_03005 [Psychrobacillus psychrodurans]
MEIQWINGQYAEDNRIFDMEMEVYEWSDSLYGDSLDGLVNKKSVGYVTPDEKVIASLSKLIPGWADHLNVKVAVHTDSITVNNICLYRIWITSSI